MNQNNSGDAMRMNQMNEAQWQALNRGDRLFLYATCALVFGIIFIGSYLFQLYMEYQYSHDSANLLSYEEVRYANKCCSRNFSDDIPSYEMPYIYTFATIFNWDLMVKIYNHAEFQYVKYLCDLRYSVILHERDESRFVFFSEIIYDHESPPEVDFIRYRYFGFDLNSAYYFLLRQSTKILVIGWPIWLALIIVMSLIYRFCTDNQFRYACIAIFLYVIVSNVMK